MIKIKDKFNFIFGIFLLAGHLMAWLVYNKTGCISMPYVHKLCGAEANGAIYASIITFMVAIYLILVGIGLLGSSKDKK